MTPKATSLPGTTSFDVFCVKINSVVYAAALLKNTKKANSHPKGTTKSRIWRAETPKPIAIKFCTPGAVQDVITPANFCEDRLRSFGVARGRIMAFSIDLIHCL